MNGPDHPVTARLTDLTELRSTVMEIDADRLTPEQEAAANQTRQEKWLSTVKDFYSQKEKIEPFQFYPEVSQPVPMAGAPAYNYSLL